MNSSSTWSGSRPPKPPNRDPDQRRRRHMRHKHMTNPESQMIDEGCPNCEGTEDIPPVTDDACPGCQCIQCETSRRAVAKPPVPQDARQPAHLKLDRWTYELMAWQEHVFEQHFRRLTCAKDGRFDERPS